MKNKTSLNRDDFNSKIFNLNFGNISTYDPTSSFNEISEIMNKSDYDIVGVKVKSVDTDFIYNLQKYGFYLVDCLVSYEFDSTKTKLPNDTYTVDFTDTVKGSEIEQLAKIASDVFRIDRFHSDPNLSKDDANRYYYQWVKNSFNGFSDGVILPSIQNKVVGFTTYKINNVDFETSTLVLSAVNPDYAGRRIYHNMILKGTNYLLSKSNKIRVGTQVDNIPVQRTWQRLGYKLISVDYIFHHYRYKR
jgi:ribosomal protein S18 acetylase RimI-like enzyme